jgi:hypothetical protein
MDALQATVSPHRARLLHALARVCAPAVCYVLSTCSLEPKKTKCRSRSFLRDDPRFHREPGRGMRRISFPSAGGPHAASQLHQKTDGAFAARPSTRGMKLTLPGAAAENVRRGAVPRLVECTAWSLGAGSAGWLLSLAAVPGSPRHQRTEGWRSSSACRRSKPKKSLVETGFKVRFREAREADPSAPGRTRGVAGSAAFLSFLPAAWSKLTLSDGPRRCRSPTSCTSIWKRRAG